MENELIIECKRCGIFLSQRNLKTKCVDDEHEEVLISCPLCKKTETQKRYVLYGEEQFKEMIFNNFVLREILIE